MRLSVMGDSYRSVFSSPMTAVIVVFEVVLRGVTAQFDVSVRLRTIRRRHVVLVRSDTSRFQGDSVSSVCEEKL